MALLWIDEHSCRSHHILLRRAILFLLQVHYLLDAQQKNAEPYDEDGVPQLVQPSNVHLDPQVYLGFTSHISLPLMPRAEGTIIENPSVT